jgi:hypothetical protein
MLFLGCGVVRVNTPVFITDTFVMARKMVNSETFIFNFLSVTCSCPCIATGQQNFCTKTYGSHDKITIL